MAKKPASFEYNGTLVKVLDGDTIDCYIDLGFDLKKISLLNPFRPLLSLYLQLVSCISVRKALTIFPNLSIWVCSVFFMIISGKCVT